MTNEALIREAEDAIGRDAVRTPGPLDVVDDVRPAIVVSPDTAERVAATLAWASAAQRRVVIRGGGTADGWGQTPDRVDVLLSLERLNRVIAHEAEDLTATVEAGATLHDINVRLSAHGQRLPLDPPRPAAATIGGILATNDSGPLRTRYGVPRDIVIGMTIATADGLLASSGGRVVKNVAGYDIARLMTGSHGSLAAIVAATFKLAPLAPASATVRATLGHAADVTSLANMLIERQCEPEAFELHITRSANTSPSCGASVLLRHASVPQAVAEATDVTRRCLEGLSASSVEVFSGEDEDARWNAHTRHDQRDCDAVLRLSWMPANLTEAADTLKTIAADLRLVWTGRVTVGSGVVGLAGGDRDILRTIAALRASPMFNHVVVTRARPAIREAVRVWPTDDTRQALWRRLKQAFDPTNTLNANRGPL